MNDRIASILDGDTHPRPADAPELLALLDDRDFFIVTGAVAALARLGARARPYIPRFVELLNSRDENVRGFVAAVLGELGGLALPAVPALTSLLQDQGRQWFQDKPRNYPVQFRAAFALAKLAPDCPDIIPVIREALNCKKLDYAQAEAFEIVRSLGPRAAPLISDLRMATTDKYQLRRVRAQLTLACLDPDYEVTDELAKKCQSSIASL